MPSLDLFAKFFLGYDASQNLFGKTLILHHNSENLFCSFSLRQGTEGLFAKFQLRQKTKDLYCRLYVRTPRSLVEFDTINKWIKINNFRYTIKQASADQTQVIINETIETNCPTSGYLYLGTETAWVHAYRNFASGWNWYSQNQEFGITSPAGTDTITLNTYCSNRAQVVAHINAKIASAFYNHSEYIEVIADPYDPYHIIFRCKNGFEGSNFGFQLFSTQPYGHPGWPGGGKDAMYTFALPKSGEYMGKSDRYAYSPPHLESTFNLDSPLTQNYKPGADPVTLGATPGCVAQLEEITLLEIYSEAMGWADEQLAIDDPVPMEALGKVSLGSGVYTDSIFQLTSGWKLRLPDGTYGFTFRGTVVTDDGSRRTSPPDLGKVDSIFQVSSFATVIEPLLSGSDLTNIASQVWATGNRGLKVDLLSLISDDIDAIRDVTRGRWLIKNNQLCFYDEDIPQSRLVAVFSLYDELGVPSVSRVFERVPMEFQGSGNLFCEFEVNP